MSEIPPPRHEPGFSNYPRYTQTPNPYQKPPGIYFEVIGEAWRIVQANMGNWVLATLIFFVVTYGVSIPFSFLANMVAYGSMMGPGYASSGFSFGAFIVAMTISMLGGLITYPIQAGFMYMGVKQVRGEIVGPGDIFSGFSRFGHVFLTYILVGLLTFVSALLCIIPCFYVVGVLAFAPILVIDKKMSAMEAITASYEALKPHGWMMFLLMFVLGLVNVLGACACGIGMLLTFPVYILGLALIYNNFFPSINLGVGGTPIGMEPPR